MSQLNDKVRSVPNICGIEIAFSGRMKPSTIEGYQAFYNSIPDNAAFQKQYASKAAIAFEEESEESAAGTSYRQRLLFRFPSSDNLRADRIEMLKKVRYIKIQLTNKQHFVIGRNDFEQNARPRLQVKTNEKLAQVEVETVSIFPTDYTPSFTAGGLPDFIPISFIND